MTRSRRGFRAGLPPEPENLLGLPGTGRGHSARSWATRRGASNPEGVVCVALGVVCFVLGLVQVLRRR